MKYVYCLVGFFLLRSMSVEAQTIPRPNIPAPQGLAVNSFTGNLFYQRNEQSLRGTGYRIYQSFYYNAAQDTLNYGYGHGWSFYYNVFYREVDDKVIIHHADARKDTFLLRSGAYQAPAGLFDVLTKSGGQFTLTSKAGEKHVFADATHKKLTRMQDTNGNFITIDYVGGNPTKITNSSGRNLLLTWENGLLKEAKDGAYPDKKFTYVYNPSKDLIAVTDPLQGRKSFAYTNHYLIRLGDENNSPVVVYYYGNGGRVKQISSCDTEQRFSFLSAQRKTFVTQKAESGNLVTGYAFDAVGRLTALTDAEGNRAEFTYDTQNNLLTQKDFKGLTTRFFYDGRGNVVKEIDPRGSATEYTYESVFNKPLTVKDKRSHTTTLSYDAKGNLTGVVRPGGQTDAYTYDAAGRQLTAKNANNHITTYQYNTDGDLVKIQYPVGAVQYEYNGNCCNVGKITDANGNTLAMTYDLLNRTKTVKNGLGHTTSYEYDAVGNVTKETDPNGTVKEYGYDGLNRLSSVKLGVGTWRYDYDGQSNLIKMTDANGHETRYAYDKKNQLIQETDPIGNAVGYRYDVSGNLTQRNDPNGNVAHYKYDELDRLIEKSYTGNTDKYSYDEAGNLTSAYNNNIAYGFEYDNLNRLLKKNIVTWGKSLAYTYDAVGNRSTMTDHDGGVTTYAYDANNRLSSLKNPANLTTTFEYDAGGRLKKQTNGNGTYSTYHYDVAGRMDSLINWKNGSEKISFFYYTFDQYGNRKTLRDKRGLNTYTYDPDHRLTNVIYADGSTESFAMDGSGNRTQRTKNGVSTPYTYNAADQIQTAGPTSFTFDANGNTVGQNDGRPRVYRYDGENRLLEIQLNPQRKVQYKYDPFGDKIEKQDTLSVLTKMLYDDDNLLSELNGGNVTQNVYTTAFGMDSWLSMKTGGNNYFYHKDGLNSTVELTGVNSIVANQYSYDIYGNKIIHIESQINDILFTGRIYEKTSQQYDVRARHYDPKTGRFENRDIFEGNANIPLSLNSYTYAYNAPTNFIDQTGNSPTSDFLFFTGGVIVGGAAAFYLGSGAAVAALAGGLVGLGQGIYDTANDPNANGSLPCYIANAASGAAVGALPVGKALNKLGLSKLFRKIGILGKRSNYDGELGVILNTDIKYIKPRGTLTKINNQGVGILGGLGAEFGAGKLLDKTKKFLGGLIPGDPCEKPKNPEGAKDSLPKTPQEDPTRVPIIAPSDPNEIVGPAGYEAIKWVSVKQNLPYKVLFENDPDFATAPAQNVTVYVPIHAKLNPSSLRLSDFGFGSFNFSVPANTSVYSNRLDVRDSLGVFVDVTAGLDIANRRAFWIFQSIDPATGLAATLPANSGFLPVNDSTRHNGEGYVTFTIIPSALAQTRDTVSAQASIIFDSEETINTNRWLNTVDAVAPLSNINALPAVVDSVFNVSWTSQDDANGSGVKDHILYVSKNNGPFTLYKDKLTATSDLLNGEPGSTLSFYTRATDNTGNVEADKTAGDRIVTVRKATTSNVACAGAVFNFSAASTAGASYRWQVDTGSGYTDISDNAVYSGTATVQLTINQAPNIYYGYKYRARITVGGNVSYSEERKLTFISTWLGTAGESWHNPANWSCGAIPDRYTDVIIPTSVPSNPVLNEDGSCHSLTMGTLGSISLKSNVKLKLATP